MSNFFSDILRERDAAAAKASQVGKPKPKKRSEFQGIVDEFLAPEKPKAPVNPVKEAQAIRGPSAFRRTVTPEDKRSAAQVRKEQAPGSFEAMADKARRLLPAKMSAEDEREFRSAVFIASQRGETDVRALVKRWKEDKAGVLADNQQFRVQREAGRGGSAGAQEEEPYDIVEDVWKDLGSVFSAVDSVNPLSMIMRGTGANKVLQDAGQAGVDLVEEFFQTDAGKALAAPAASFAASLGVPGAEGYRDFMAGGVSGAAQTIPSIVADIGRAADESLAPERRLQAATAAAGNILTMDFAALKLIAPQLRKAIPALKAAGVADETIRQVDEVVRKVELDPAWADEIPQATFRPKVGAPVGEHQVSQTDALGNALRSMGWDESKVRGTLAAVNPILEQNPGTIFRVVDQIDPSGKLRQEVERIAIEINPDDLSREVLSKMDRAAKAMGYDSRGADDVLQMLKTRLASDGVLTHPDWVKAYQKAIGSRSARIAAKEARESLPNVRWDRVRELGTTQDIREGGYIKPDGAFVDLSGKREGGPSGSRSLDHRAVGSTAGMQELIAEGYIRMDHNSGYIDIGKAPTANQYRQIARLASDHNGEIVIDMSDGLGELRDTYYLNPERTFSREYPAGTRYERIKADIDRFFNGEDPLPINKFRQEDGGVTKGAYSPETRVIELVNGKADVSTVIHEVAHDWHGFLQSHPTHGPVIQRIYGGLDNVEGAERFARDFEKFLASGVSPVRELQSVFEAFKQWMRDIYGKVFGDKIPEDVKAIFREAYSNPSDETARLIREFEGSQPPVNRVLQAEVPPAQSAPTSPQLAPDVPPQAPPIQRPQSQVPDLRAGLKEAPVAKAETPESRWSTAESPVRRDAENAAFRVKPEYSQVNDFDGPVFNLGKTATELTRGQTPRTFKNTARLNQRLAGEQKEIRFTFIAPTDRDVSRYLRRINAYLDGTGYRAEAPKARTERGNTFIDSYVVRAKRVDAANQSVPPVKQVEGGKKTERLYHGTMSSFDDFSSEFFNTRTKGEPGSRDAFFFSRSKDSADSYAYDDETMTGGRIIEADVSYSRPLELPKSPTAADIARAKAEGYDAIVTPYEVAVFDPSNIRQINSEPGITGRLVQDAVSQLNDRQIKNTPTAPTSPQLAPDVPPQAPPIQRPEPEQVGIRNAETAALRQEQGLPPDVRPNPKTGLFEDVEAAGLAAHKADPNRAKLLVEEFVGGSDRQIEDVEQGILLAHLNEQADAARAALRNLGGIDPKAPGYSQAKAAYDLAQGELDRVTEALQKAGSPLGRALALRKLGMAVDFGDSVLGKAYGATKKGSPLSASQSRSFDEFSAELAAKDKRIGELETQLSKAQEQVAKRTSPRTDRRQAVISKRENLAQRIAAQKAKGPATAKPMSKQGGAFNYPVDPELARLRWEYAKTYVEEGIYKLDDIIARVAGDLGEDEAEILASFVARKREVKTLSDELLVQQMRKRQILHDARRYAEELSLNPMQRGWREISGTTRALSSTADLSAAFNQGGKLIFSNPVTWARSFARSVKAFGSEAFAARFMSELVDSPNYPLYMRGKLAVGPEFLEENMSVGLAVQRIPILKEVFKGSDRAYQVFLQNARREIFDQMMRGVAPELRQEAAAATGRFANIATGRGDLGKFSQAADKMANWLWSPRNLAAQWQYASIGSSFKGTGATAGGKAAAGQIAKQYIKGFSGFFAAMTAAGMAGYEFDTDPKSKTFGRLLTDDEVIDLSGGAFGPMSFITKLGQNFQADSGNPFQDVGMTTFNYARSKASPIGGTILSLIDRQDYIGNAVPTTSPEKRARAERAGKQSYDWGQFLGKQVLMPLSQREFYDALVEEFSKDKTTPPDVKKLLLTEFRSLLGIRVSPRRYK